MSMDYLEAFVAGKMPASDFYNKLKTCTELQNEIRMLIPEEARNNRNHAIWKTNTYSVYCEYGFDCYELINALFMFDNTLGDNLDVHSTIMDAYCFLHPEVTPTQYYRDAFGLFLDAVGDKYDGPEVHSLIEKIINNAISIKPKAKRVSTVKQQIKTVFHIEGTNYPRWIQGPEWPMGVESPMQFIGRERKGEQVVFLFRDVATGDEKKIVQFY